MANLIACSQILYNKEISNLKKETTALKNRSIFYEYPKIKYSKLEWETINNKAHELIKTGLKDYITDNDFEYEHMEYQGITSRQWVHLPTYINEALNLITKHKYKEWSYFNSNNIIGNISTCFNGFIAITNGNLSTILDLEPESMSNLLFNIIVEYFNNLCDDIPIFICETCKNTLTYDEDACEERCLDCLS